MILVIKKVWNIFLILLLAKTTLTAVSKYVMTAVAETVDCQKTVVSTAWQRVRRVVYFKDKMSFMDSMLVFGPYVIDNILLQQEQHQRHP